MYMMKLVKKHICDKILLLVGVANFHSWVEKDLNKSECNYVLGLVLIFHASDFKVGLTIVYELLWLFKMPFPMSQNIADTMAYLQGEGRLLRGEHNHLCEAFLVMASSAGYLATKPF